MVLDLMVLLEICPIAPPGAQQYTDKLTGYVLWGVITLFVIGVVISIGAIVAGRIFSMPHASKAGVVGVAVVFLAAIAYLVLPGLISSMTGNGCIANSPGAEASARATPGR